MPSVGMRRTTRVFGVVKAADRARVLRSGRRIWPNVDLPKVKDEKEEDFRVKKRVKLITEAVGDEKTVNKKFGIVYSRKRKRVSELSRYRSEESVQRLKFYCRRRILLCPLITLTVDGSCEECWFSSVFGLVMRYSKRQELRLSTLASFFLSQPINDVFADHGVRFLAKPPLSSRGVCMFLGAVNCLPLFSIYFTAIPRCFMDLHFSRFLKVASHSFSFVKKALYLLNNPVEESDSESELVLTPRNGGVVGLHPSVRASKLTGGNAQCRGNLGFHSFQKRRSSLRRRRRSLSHSAHKLYNGTLASAVSSRKLQSSVLNSPSLGSNGISITPKPKTKEELDSLCCSANILIIASDKCTREEGFSVMLEFSSSKEWFIVIKRDEAIRYSHKARKTMRPCSCNRFTHSIVWTIDNNWKLEFCNRQDWLGFKDIYKECYERNILEQNAKVIPIPGVREVCGYSEDANDFPSFSRPVPYISVKEDEVSRAMGRSITLYDIDSEDEEWLEMQNSEEDQQLDRDMFELMIDGFEKFYFHNPADDLLDEKAATIASLSYLSRQEVIEAVYGYWSRKRKQRKASLLRVFQGHQAKKPLLSKPVFRKKRSFKRQGSQLHGKAKQLSSVAVKAAAEQEAWEEQNILLRVEEVKALADTSTEIAIAKRRRAQVVAEQADLAVYKAMMALRIAEAIKIAESTGCCHSPFLELVD